MDNFQRGLTWHEVLAEIMAGRTSLDGVYMSPEDMKKLAAGPPHDIAYQTPEDAKRDEEHRQAAKPEWLEDWLCETTLDDVFTPSDEIPRWEDEYHGTNDLDELRRKFRQRLYGQPKPSTHGQI